MALITTALGLVNLALNHLGQKRIAALDTTTEIGRKADSIYETAIYEALRQVKPNFAKKRAIFHHTVQAEKTITGATAADPVVITVASHGFANDDVIAVWDVGGMTDLNGKRYIVTVLSASTFSLADENGNDIDGSEFDAYTSGGKCGLVSDEPEFGYIYRYTLPSDYIILLEVNGNDALTLDHSVENGELLTNEPEIKAQYIYANTTVSSWDADFLMLASYKLAEHLAMTITNLSGLAGHWREMFLAKNIQTRGTKSQESGTNQGPQRKAIVDQWTNARNGN